MNTPNEDEIKQEQNDTEVVDEIKEDATEVQEECASDNQPDSKDKLLAEEYLNLARVIQADFDNYRKRSIQELEKAKQDAIAKTVEVLLPSLDSFKKVKETITDEKTLEGISMLEKAIISNLEKLGVEKIEAVGKPLDPNLHNVLAVAKDESKEDDIILDEFQAGYKMKDKVIRYSQVLVNKL